jgi:hypothetical protein
MPEVTQQADVVWLNLFELAEDPASAAAVSS